MNKNNSRFSIIVVKKTKESPNSQELKFLSNPKSLIFYKSQLEIKPLCNQWKSGRVKRKQKVKKKKKKLISTLMDLTGGLFKFFKCFLTSSFWIEPPLLPPLPVVVLMVALPAQVKGTNKTNKQKHNPKLTSIKASPNANAKACNFMRIVKWVLKRN